jgi:pimeloyl-ACP methyl ester carboxylesterase
MNTQLDKHRTFVLVHGSWYGGWAWKNVIAILRQQGHEASAPTLTGVGERRHVGNSTATLMTHIEDVATHVEMEDLNDVTIVGWSYGGVVATGALAHVANRTRSLIYLDAFVPEDGKAIVDYLRPEVRMAWTQFKVADKPIPPLSFEYVGITDQTLIEFVRPKVTDQPWRTVFDPFVGDTKTPPIPTSYIRCSATESIHFDEALNRLRTRQTIKTAKINCGHMCVLTDPAQTTRALTELA